MYTIYKLVSANSGLKFHFPSKIIELKCKPNAFQLDANNANIVYYGKTPVRPDPDQLTAL